MFPQATVRLVLELIRMINDEKFVDGWPGRYAGGVIATTQMRPFWAETEKTATSITACLFGTS